jgi:transcription antitermination protein NusB
MSNMHKSRELAMQVLFLWDAQAQSDPALAAQVIGDSAADEPTRQRALGMSESAWAVRESADQQIEKLAPQWPTRRQPGVDRAILRLAVWELGTPGTPPKVVIDEAIELAKEYSTENSPAFINGVLDAVLRGKNEINRGDAESAENSEKAS